MKKILITGASSYVGARLYFDLIKDYEVIGTYSNAPLSTKFVKLDVTNERDVSSIIAKFHPDIILHVAANANARWCEANPELAIALNQKATQYIVNSANTIDASLIFVSSFAAIKPTNLYGKTKQESEKMVKTIENSWIILRPSLILGYSPNTTNDRPFNRLLTNLDKGTPAVYDTSWKFQVTYVGHISEVTKMVIEKNIANEIIPIATEEMKSRFDTARDILSPFGVTVVPIDKHDPLPSIKEDVSDLKRLQLPFYTYTQIIEKIVSEIKNREYFKL